jgi:hypothetical protein
MVLKEPIEISPNTNYTAVATLKGLDSHYGTKGLRKVRSNLGVIIVNVDPDDPDKGVDIRLCGSGFGSCPRICGSECQQKRKYIIQIFRK